jgi:hypothetical protein
MTDTALATIMASVPAALIAWGGIMKVRSDAKKDAVESEARIKLEAEAAESRLKAENEAIAKHVLDRLKETAKDVEEKLVEAEKVQSDKLETIHKTFNSRMEKAMEELRSKYYAMGLKDGEDRARVAIENEVKSPKQ